MIRRRHERWSLLVQVTCATSILWLVASGAPRSTASDTGERILGDKVGAPLEYSRNPNDLLLFPTSASIPPVEPSWLVHRQNSTEQHDEPHASHPKVPEGGQTSKWHFTYISARFLTGKAFRARASAVSRAVVGAVFIAISLIIAVAMFTCIWCCCRCDNGRGYDGQIEAQTASYSSFQPPMPRQGKAPPSEACPASTPQSTDLPPPYDLPSLHVVVSPKAVPGRPRPMAAAPEDEPPSYHSAVSSIHPNAETGNIGAPSSP
ncbi:uncharacterized protein LOC144161990 [Haemaphysalis longicornis]